MYLFRKLCRMGLRETIGRRTALVALIAATAETDAATDRAAADSVSDFYAGKQMKFILRSDPGGGFDLYSRLIATHIVRHIPGHPTIVAVNMPGAGGIRAASYVGEIAPRDGTVVTIIGQALPMDQPLHFTPTFKVDLRTFGWIGNVNFSNLLTYTWHTSPTKTMEDAKNRDTRIKVNSVFLPYGSAPTWMARFQ